MIKKRRTSVEVNHLVMAVLVMRALRYRMIELSDPIDGVTVVFVVVDNSSLPQ